MRDKLTCTYRGHSFEDVLNVITNLCTCIETEPSVENLRRLSGALSYVSLFLIPDYDLTAGKAYTVENTCYHVDGIIKLSYHAIVSAFYELTCLRVNVPETLMKILSDCAFGETMSTLRVPMRDIYVALLRSYCGITKAPFTFNTEESWYNIQLAFLEEVHYFGD